MLLSQQSLTDLETRHSQNLTFPTYDRTQTKIGIVHLGPGAFHRAHQAIYTESVLNKYGGDWRVCGVSMRSSGVKDTLLPQDNLYTLAVLDDEIKYQVIGALKEVLVASKELPLVLKRMSAPTTKIVSLTVTEKGYCLDSQGVLDLSHADIKHDLSSPNTPISAVGLIVEALRLRFEQGTKAFNVISCDNLPGNGHKLAAAVKVYAERLDQKLASWISVNVSFPCTMVDSITPKTEDYVVNAVSNILKVRDEWPIQREEFTQWVIEDSFKGERPAWEEVGVIFSHDIDGFENAKLRILNGMHSTLAYLGSLAGLETVKEAISSPELLGLMRRLAEQEIIPSLTPPKELNLEQYLNSVIKRFQNPQIKHLLGQIAWDGSKKLPVRILDTIIDNLNAGRSTKYLCLCIAAWIRFLRLAALQKQEIVDPRANELLKIASSFTENSQQDVSKLLNLDDLIPTELITKSQFIDDVVAAYQLLLDNDEEILTALEAF